MNKERKLHKCDLETRDFKRKQRFSWIPFNHYVSIITYIIIPVLPPGGYVHNRTVIVKYF